MGGCLKPHMLLESRLRQFSPVCSKRLELVSNSTWLVQAAFFLQLAALDMFMTVARCESMEWLSSGSMEQRAAEAGCINSFETAL